jgi:hypothetical protein
VTRSARHAELGVRTGEYILDPVIRGQLLDLMQKQGKNKACGFIGPFDAVIRDGPTPTMAGACFPLHAQPVWAGGVSGWACRRDHHAHQGGGR